MTDGVIDIGDGNGSGRRKSGLGKAGIIRLREAVCFVRVKEMLESGMFIRLVAEYIQDSQSELTDIPQDRLIGILRRYRDTLEQAGLDVTAPGKQGSREPFHEITELQKLFDSHCGRIEMEVETEKQLTKLFSNTHKEMQTATFMAVAIMKMKEAMGIIGKNAQSQTTRQFSGRVDVAKIAQDAQSRQKVLNVFELMVGDSKMMADLVESGGIAGMKQRLEVGDIPLDEVMTQEGIMHASMDGGASREASKIGRGGKPRTKGRAAARARRKKKREPITAEMIERIKSRMSKES